MTIFLAIILSLAKPDVHLKQEKELSCYLVNEKGFESDSFEIRVLNNENIVTDVRFFSNDYTPTVINNIAFIYNSDNCFYYNAFLKQFSSINSSELNNFIRAGGNFRAVYTHSEDSYAEIDIVKPICVGNEMFIDTSRFLIRVVRPDRVSSPEFMTLTTEDNSLLFLAHADIAYYPENPLVYVNLDAIKENNSYESYSLDNGAFSEPYRSLKTFGDSVFVFMRDYTVYPINNLDSSFYFREITRLDYSIENTELDTALKIKDCIVLDRDQFLVIFEDNTVYLRRFNNDSSFYFKLSSRLDFDYDKLYKLGERVYFEIGNKLFFTSIVYDEFGVAKLVSNSLEPIESEFYLFTNENLFLIRKLN